MIIIFTCTMNVLQSFVHSAHLLSQGFNVAKIFGTYDFYQKIRYYPNFREKHAILCDKVVFF